MDYDHLAVDLGNQITEMLSREMDFSVWQKSLAEIVNGSMPDMKAAVSENMQQSTSAFADAFLRIEPVDITSVAAACLNSVTEQLNSSVYQNMASQWADVLLKSIQALPIEEFETRQEIPAEEVQEALADVKSCLPEEAADAVDLKLKADEQSSGRIPWRTVMEIITFIICILSFVKECLPDDQLGKIIELLSQDTEVVEGSGDISEALDNPVFEIMYKNQMSEDSQGKQKDGNVGNQPTTL